MNDNVSKEVFEVHLEHIRESLHEVRNSLGAIEVVTQATTKNTLLLITAQETLDNVVAASTTNTKDIIVINTHKKYITFFSVATVGMLIAWIKSKFV